MAVRRNSRARRPACFAQVTLPLVEVMERRVLLASQISGQVWNDLDGDQVRDANEPALAGWCVYLDQNRDMARDGGEPYTLTAEDGRYCFANLLPGRYYVGQELPPGWEQTSPGVLGAAPPPATVTLSYTGSTAPITMAGSRLRVSVQPSEAEPNALVNLPGLRADPRFADLDGRGYAIVIIDTGIDADHPFFGPDRDGNGVADRIVYQHDFTSGADTATDHDGHGSAVSSIAAGGDPRYGGIAPDANIIALKVFTDGGSGEFASVERALQWCVANAAAYNIAAVNLSLGDGQNWSSAQQLYGISDELSALASEDVIVVSAGGDGYYSYQTPGVSYPAADFNALAVGAVHYGAFGFLPYAGGAVDFSTTADRLAGFSQRSALLTNVLAPGAMVAGADQDGGVAVYNGSGLAAPRVAGTAVLAQQLAVRQLGRRLTMAEFAGLLYSTGVTTFDGDDENDNVGNSYAEYRRVDVYALAQVIYSMNTTRPYGYVVDLGLANTVTADFGAAPGDLTPGAPDLAPLSDTGRSDCDNLTRYNNAYYPARLQFTVGGTIAGAEVRLYANGVLIGQGVGTDARTTLWTDGLAALADGPVTFTARQAVAGGAESPDSPPLLVRIDTVAPERPVRPDLWNALDTGVDDEDNFTQNNRPVVDLLSTDPGYLSLYWGIRRLNTRYVQGNDPFSIMLVGGVQFTASAPVATGAGPYDVAIGDVNGDGKPDLVTANAIAGTLGVSLGRGDGTFASAVVTPRVQGCTGVSLADFNHDGRLDALVSANSAEIAILFGTGTGAFIPGPVLVSPAGASIVDVLAADVNGDGRADAIAVDRGSRLLRIFLGNAGGGFGSARSCPAGGATPFDPHVADVNLDGRADLLVGNDQDDQITVLLGNGDGTFAAPISISVGENPVGFAVADFDFDGIPDITVTENGEAAIEFLKGHGDGTFSRLPSRGGMPAGQFPTNHNSSGGIAADFDGDGILDYATTAQSGGAWLDVLCGNGDGSFRPYVEFALAGAPMALQGADLNGDGRTDLVSAAYGTDTLAVLLATHVPASDGRYSLSCLLEDEAGNIAVPSETLVLTVDNAPVAELPVLDVNMGSAERSTVRWIAVTFSEPIYLPRTALSVVFSSGLPIPNVTFDLDDPLQDHQGYVLSFSGSGAAGWSLPDGVFDVVFSAAGIEDLAGNPWIGPAGCTLRFHRLFGDVDGNGVVNALDYAKLKATYGRTANDPLFNDAVDYDYNGVINALDLAQFRKRYGKILLA